MFYFSPQLKESQLKLWIYRGHETSVNSGEMPFCNFVNIKLNPDVKPGVGVKGNMGTILLENPKGDYFLTYEELVKQVREIIRLGQSIHPFDGANTFWPGSLALFIKKTQGD